MSNVDFAEVDRQTEHLQHPGEYDGQAGRPVDLPGVVLGQPGEKTWKCFNLAITKLFLGKVSFNFPLSTQFNQTAFNGLMVIVSQLIRIII